MSIPRRILALALGLAVGATAISAGVVSAASSQVKLVPILTGYERPLLVTNNGRKNRVIFIVEQGGRISRATFSRNGWRKQGTFLDISDRIGTRERGDQGLLGLVFHPRYDRNGRFYVVYTRNAVGTESVEVVLAEYRRRNAARANKASQRILMAIKSTQHNAGGLAFGPDGLLYVSVGDGKGGGDPLDNGQDKLTLLGTILRIDPLDPDRKGPRRYAVPRSNPFVGKPGRNEIWAYGLRNPWRFSFDRRNGNLWIGDPGESRREEVDKAASNRLRRNAGRGRNFGWSDCEGGLEFKNDESDADDTCSTHTLPIFEYATDRDSGWCSVVGGHVHRGPVAPTWRGLYVAGDYCGQLFVLNQAGKLRLASDSGVSISSFGEDSAGRLYATGIGEGTIYRVAMNGPRPK